jgi:dienelactone hydrolase
MKRVIEIIIWVLLFYVASTLQSAEMVMPATRLPRTNLLVYHNPQGDVMPVRSKADWLKRRAEIVAGAQAIMGRLPGADKRCPLEVRAEAEVDCGTYVRRFITYASEPRSRVPAFLLIPKSALAHRKRVPAILALHPTDMEQGHRVIVEDVRQYYPAYARELAERGFVVLAPAYPLLANYQPDLHTLGYQSGTMKAIWDNVRGLDLLDSLPFVQKGKLGAIGHSLGGHNSIYTALFDQRIKVVVSSCGFDSFQDYMNGNIKGWTSERYMPRLLEYQGQLSNVPFDFHELIGALAPRTVFISAPYGDTNFKWSSVDEIARAAEPVYQLYHVLQNLHVEHPDCAHEFPARVRERAYELLEKTLR